MSLLLHMVDPAKTLPENELTKIDLCDAKISFPLLCRWIDRRDRAIRALADCERIETPERMESERLRVSFKMFL